MPCDARDKNIIRGLLAIKIHPAFSGGLLGMGTSKTYFGLDCETLLCYFCSFTSFCSEHGSFSRIVILIDVWKLLQLCHLIKHTTLSHKSNCSCIQKPSQVQAYPDQKNVGIFIWQSSCCGTGMRHWQHTALPSLSCTS